MTGKIAASFSSDARLAGGYGRSVESPADASISIVIPTRNERRALEDVAPLRDHAQIVIADGGSTDSTPDHARELGFDVVESQPGRGRQMNAGATAASGDLLLFLHADTTLPTGWPGEVRRVLGESDLGAFSFRLPAPGWKFRLIEKAVRLRRLPYGDQGLFLRRATFDRLGGFAEWPILEDLDLVDRVRQFGRVQISPLPAETSARRYERLGLLRTTLCNQRCLWAYRMGVLPERIARWRPPLCSMEDGQASRKRQRVCRDRSPARGGQSREELETMGSVPEREAVGHGS